MPPLTTAQLRRHLVRRSLFAPTTLAAAVARLGFVQADPIRAPARAQDLILRHRVAGYRAGDLERAYPAPDIPGGPPDGGPPDGGPPDGGPPDGGPLEEDLLYAYGFVPPATRALLHPRLDAHGAPHEPAGLAREVLAFVRERAAGEHLAGDGGPTHPREVAAAFGVRRERNAWGGQSRATTRALEHLHYWGLLRVARREQGVRVYAPARPLPAPPLPPEERLRRLTLLVADLFGPLPEASLRELLALVCRLGAPHLAPRHAGGRRGLVEGLLRAGALASGPVDGVGYVWPAGSPPGDADDASDDRRTPRVRLLAPFDPVVWDRRRFEHLWGWPYRFEAYTPAARRERGHYALPLLWGDRAAGWATLAVRGGRLDAAVGFAGRPLAGRAFAAALGAELARVRAFLGAAA